MVTQVFSHKHLGLTFDTKLSFISHINEKIKRSMQGIGILKYLSKYLPLNSLIQIYKLFIRPHFDYADVIYHTPSVTNLFNNSISLNNLMERVEKIQYRAALIITGTWQGSSRNKLYEELGWESLHDRRRLRCLIQFYKIHNNMTPANLKNQLPPLRRILYGNRNTNIYHNIFCNKTKYMNSFFPNTIKAWNNIDDEYRSSSSLDMFKNRLLILFRPKFKAVFGIHSLKDLRWLYQLRVGLSPLKSHKRKHGFKDSPSDWCDCKCAPEDTYHFILCCPIYHLERLNLLNTTSNILAANNILNPIFNVYLFLYGEPTINDDDNRKIILSLIQYIKDTNRFSG